MVSYVIIFPAAAYMLGSIPFGKLIAKKAASIDITTQGSRNIGATNVARVVGVKWGIITLILDMLKGLVPVLLFSFIAPDGTPHREIGLAGIGLCALLGHQFPLFLRFRGGKGVATALGVYLAISPFSCFAILLIFLLVVFIWDMVSLGSMISMSALPVVLFLFGESQAVVVGSIIMAAFICFKHRENIQRLVKGGERKWSDRGR
ncbi:MAG: glycerol-3-phosphate 1-O-acyltransferase PlsY [Deltaproteobacteria bacterium]|nr:glycerol-3-phosphate 1-O-acyltransferase PlsY [Deltaproteobacteria bacterium]